MIYRYIDLSLSLSIAISESSTEAEGEQVAQLSRWSAIEYESGSHGFTIGEGAPSISHFDIMKLSQTFHLTSVDVQKTCSF